RPASIHETSPDFALIWRSPPLVVELSKRESSSMTTRCGRRCVCKGTAVPGATRERVATTFATLSRVAPGTAVPLHTHRLPHLVVMLDDSRLLSSTTNGGERQISAKSGDVSWIEAGL